MPENCKKKCLATSGAIIGTLMAWTPYGNPITRKKHVKRHFRSTLLGSSTCLTASKQRVVTVSHSANSSALVANYVSNFVS